MPRTDCGNGPWWAHRRSQFPPLHLTSHDCLSQKESWNRTLQEDIEKLHWGWKCCLKKGRWSCQNFRHLVWCLKCRCHWLLRPQRSGPGIPFPLEIFSESKFAPEVLIFVAFGRGEVEEQDNNQRLAVTKWRCTCVCVCVCDRIQSCHLGLDTSLPCLSTKHTYMSAGDASCAAEQRIMLSDTFLSPLLQLKIGLPQSLS